MKTHKLSDILDCDAWLALCAFFLSWSKSSSCGDGGLRHGGGFCVDRGIDVVEATADDELSDVDQRKTEIFFLEGAELTARRAHYQIYPERCTRS